jgi:Golgi SNAP receptor complex protein 2
MIGAGFGGGGGGGLGSGSLFAAPPSGAGSGASASGGANAAKQLMEEKDRRASRVLFELRAQMDELAAAEEGGGAAAPLHSRISNLFAELGRLVKEMDDLGHGRVQNRRAHDPWDFKVQTLRAELTRLQAAHRAYGERAQARQNRHELLGGAARPAADPSAPLPSGDGTGVAHLVRQHASLERSEALADEVEISGLHIIESLVGQNERLLGVDRRLTDMGQVLSMSTSLMRTIRRRLREDRYLVFGGIAVLSVFFVLLLLFV